MADEQSFMSKPQTFNCDTEPTDFLMVRRVGTPGSGEAIVSLSMFVQEFEYGEDDYENTYVSGIMLNPAAARRCAMQMIMLADEADGANTSFLPAGTLFVGDPDDE